MSLTKQNPRVHSGSIKINELTLNEFKGVTGAFELAPVTAIVGTNFSGKTALLDAVTIALLGSHPRVGSSVAKLRQFAGGNGFQIDLAFDSGSTCHYSQGEKTVEQRPVGVPPALLDVRDYFERTAGERVRYVFERSHPEGFSKQVMLDEILALEVTPTAKTRPIIEGIAADLDFIKKDNDITWLNAAQTWLTEQRKKDRDEAKSYADSLKALKHSGPTPKDASKELKEAESAYVVVEKVLRELESKVREADAVLRSIKSQQQLVETRAKLESTVVTLEKELAAMPPLASLPQAKVCPTCGYAPVDRAAIDKAHEYHTREAALVSTKNHLAKFPCMESLSPPQVERPTPEHVTAATAAVDAASRAVVRLREQQQAYAVYAALRQKREATEAKLIESDTRVVAVDAIHEVVTERQRKLCGDAMNRLLATAAKFTDGILKSPLEYCDGEIGFRVNGAFVSHVTFSGTEQLVAYAGLSVALAQESPFKIVLLDEMGRLDHGNKNLFMERLLSLVQEGVLDQVLLVDVEAPSIPDSEWFATINL